MADYIQYEALTQAAKRGVMRAALRQVAENGTMPGAHHFYITFRTRAPGVKIADYIIQKYPEEMTIVIQHQFWDLEVLPDRFEVVLKFSGVPQHLDIPFSAVTKFIDPSANFGLDFAQGLQDLPVIEPGDDDGHEQADVAVMTPVSNAETEGTVVNLDAFRKR